PRQLDHRADLDGAPARPRDPGGDPDSLIEIPGVDQEITAELFARFRKRTVGHEPLAVAHANARRGGRRVQRGGGQILSARVEFLREPYGLFITLLAPGLVQGLFV